MGKKKKELHEHKMEEKRTKTKIFTVENYVIFRRHAEGRDGQQGNRLLKGIK